MAMYKTQFIATDTIVVAIPKRVLRQLAVNNREDGQNTYIRLVCPTLRTPATPNHISVSTAIDTQNPTTMPINNSRVGMGYFST